MGVLNSAIIGLGTPANKLSSSFLQSGQFEEKEQVREICGGIPTYISGMRMHALAMNFSSLARPSLGWGKHELRCNYCANNGLAPQCMANRDCNTYASSLAQGF